WGRVGSVITDSSTATATTDFRTAGVSTVTFTAQNAGAAGVGIRIDFVKVNDPAKPAAAVTAADPLAKTMTIEINTFSQPARRSTNFNLPGISATFIAKAPGSQGNGIQLLFTQRDLG